MENKIYGYIYMITNLINNKRYIGQTIEKIKIRFKGHINESKKEYSNMAIARAIKKYGIENFTIEQIDVAYNQKELNLLEGVYISWFNTLIINCNGYNITNIVNGLGKHSDKTKQKMRNIATTKERLKKQSQLGKRRRGKAIKNSSSKYCGVHIKSDKWCAYNYFNNKKIHLGYYLLEDDAAKARDIAEIKIFGENAVLNFPELKDQYLNNRIIVNKCPRNKSNSSILGLWYCNTDKRWRYKKNKKTKSFRTQQEAENYALKDS